MVQVCAPIAAADPAALRAQAAQAKREGADVVEIRLDTCAKHLTNGASLDDLIATIPHLALPVITTIRHAFEGGDWDGSDSERATLFTAADRAGAAYIDCELAFVDRIARPKHAKLILSQHDFSGMGGDLPAAVARMRGNGAAIAKVAVTPHDAADLATLEHLHRVAADLPLIALGMGEHGLPSRLLTAAWGGYLTFGRLSGLPGSAPGQPTVKELVKVYRVRAHGAETRIFGVIGNPIRHSLSPLIHNAALAHHGIDAVYVPFLVSDAGAFWRACGGWIDGLSITIPHKQALLDVVDDLEPLARSIGAINTLWRNDRQALIGANTDASAAVSCIETQHGSLTGRRVMLLGAGGVCRAIAFAVVERGAQLTIANRSLERAQELAAEVGAHAVELADAPGREFDVLINGTSVGMEDEGGSPWPANAHRVDSIVFDTVYTPLETRLLREAQLAGATTICGLSMFIGQAIGQYKRWTGLDAPEALMYRLALERLGGHQATGTERKKNAASGDRRSTNALEGTLGGAMPG